MSGPTTHPLSAADGEALVALAAQTVRSRLSGTPIDGRPPRQAVLRGLGCSFVTLEYDGALRGCIGSLEPNRPLYRDVARNAGRALADPRMDPVGPDEWPGLEVIVSVLSRSELVSPRGLPELRRLLRPHVDGLVLAVGSKQATFLPSVWEKLPDPTDFVAALLAKGGWEDDRLPTGASVLRYTAIEFHDGGPHDPL